MQFSSAPTKVMTILEKAIVVLPNFPIGYID